MLKLFWTPGRACIPDQPAWQTMTDALCADDATSAPLQTFRRAGPEFVAAEPPLAGWLDTWLAGRASPGGPAYVLVHGFQYDPGGAPGSTGSPFSTVYGYPGPGGPDPHLSLLPLVGECDAQGGNRADVAIAFAWTSEGSFADDIASGWNNDYKYAALDLSPAAARALATVLAHLAAKGVAVRLLAHSLGTRTTSQAIRVLAAAGAAIPLERAVLLAGAEFSVDTAANFAGCQFDVVNVGSRCDEVLIAGEIACDPVRHNNTFPSFVLGRNGLGGNASWLDLQLDRTALVTWLAQGGAPTGTPYQVDAVAETDVHPFGDLNHWASYTNDGNRALVRDLMTDARMTVAALAAAGVPNGFDCPEYGHFIGQPVPPTPMTRAGRSVQVAQAHGRAGAVG